MAPCLSVAMFRISDHAQLSVAWLGLWRQTSLTLQPWILGRRGSPAAIIADRKSGTTTFREILELPQGDLSPMAVDMGPFAGQ